MPGSDDRGPNAAGAFDAEIGDEVRARRLLIGMTQEKLGVALGVSFQQVQKYEKGVNRISASRLRQIASALDVPVTHFYGADENGVAINPGETTEGSRLLRAFTQIEDSLVRQRIIDLVEGFAASD